MFNLLGRTIFTLTAMAPVGLTFAIATWQEDRRFAYSALTASAALWILCVLFLALAKAQLERVTLQPASVEAADRENIAYLLLYLSPLFTSSTSQLNWSLLVPTIIVFALVSATGYNYHFSPLMGLMGWHAYRVSDASGVTYVVFTRRQMRSALSQIQVVQLTEYVLLDVSRI